MSQYVYLGARLVKLLMSEMELVTRVQILDEAVSLRACIHLFYHRLWVSSRTNWVL